MRDLHERVFEMRRSVIAELSQEDQTLAEMIEDNGYFITKIRSGGEDIFMIIDFTSKHEEHVYDLAAYSEKIYYNFLGKIYRC